MQNQEDRIINGLKVVTRQLAPMRAFRLLAKLGKFAGPISRALTPSAVAAVKSGNYTAAVPVALSVFTELKDDEAEALALDILGGSFAEATDGNGRKRLLSLESTDQINAAFDGNLRAMLGAMLFSLEVNYKDFFAVRGEKPPGNPPPPEKTPSP
jgi:hypothetical protein